MLQYRAGGSRYAMQSTDLNAALTSPGAGSNCVMLRTNGLNLNVHIQGEGPPVLLVHGFPDTHAVWHRQIPALVAAGYRVIAPDMRGCGLSDMPPRVADYQLDLLVADVIGLLDTLGIDKVKLVAHDWGAVIGWQLCLRHPQRVQRYVALSVGHPNAYAGAGLMQKLKGYYILLIQLRGIAEAVMRVGNWWLLRRMAGDSGEFPQWRGQLERPGRLTAAMNYYRANGWALLFKRDWPRMKVPVLGVWSSGDHYLVESQMEQSRYQVDATWRYQRIEGADHWLQLSAAARVSKLVLDYLA
jgi:pimeloyl-ACP methyl ester carboxylesterase